MRVETVIEFLPKGSTKPFLALDENGRQIVVKAMLRPTMGKILLNEFLAGNLATVIGLPSPVTSLATLGPEALQFLQRNSIHVASEDCVAINFVEGLKPIEWPDPPQGQERWDMSNFDLLPEINRKHIALFFDNPEKQAAFYGRALFEIWLFMQDTKYDALFVKEDRTPFFLDGSHAFEGSDWEFDQMVYSHPKSLPQSAYLEGILTDPSLYEQWFDSIASLPDERIDTLVKMIPSTWGITRSQLDFVLNLLTEKRPEFISNVKEEIKSQEFMKDWLRR